MSKEMIVKEETKYCIGEFECPICKKKYRIYCKPKKDNPNMRSKGNKHYIE